MQNIRLSRKQLASLTKSLQTQKDKKGRSLLQRAREYLMEHPKADKYTTTITYTLEDGKLFVDWDCSCKDADRHHNDGLACKHAVALLILEHRDILETHKGWADWFKQYDEVLKKAVEKEFKEVLEDFGNF
ncbi:MAG: SWIM zinc finger family protein [Candidatus Bathyarchaeia archaeon]